MADQYLITHMISSILFTFEDFYSNFNFRIVLRQYSPMDFPKVPWKCVSMVENVFNGGDA